MPIQRRPQLESHDQPALVGLEAVPTATRRTRRSHVLDFRELARWAHVQVDWIAAKSRTDRRSDLFLFTQAAKLVEEVGELHAELLARIFRDLVSRDRRRGSRPAWA